MAVLSLFLCWLAVSVAAAIISVNADRRDLERFSVGNQVDAGRRDPVGSSAGTPAR